MTLVTKKPNGKHPEGKSAELGSTSDAEWRDVTGKFKIVFERMEKDQEANNERVRRQTETIKRHASEPTSKVLRAVKAAKR
jgi:hypothetical protein